MPSTWLPSARSARAARIVGCTSTARSPRARAKKKTAYAPSSATSATPSTDSCSSTPDRGSGRTPRTTHSLRDRLSNPARPALRRSHSRNPSRPLRRHTLARRLDCIAPGKLLENWGLDSKRIRMGQAVRIPRPARRPLWSVLLTRLDVPAAPERPSRRPSTPAPRGNGSPVAGGCRS